MKRRDLLKALPLGVAAASLPIRIPGFSADAFGKSPMLDALLGGADSDRVLVLINLQGGNDGLNTVIPFTEQLYIDNRKDDTQSSASVGFVTSAEQQLLQASVLSTSGTSRPGLALNPMMADKTGITYPSFYEMFQAGKVALINNVGYAEPNLSHFRSTDIWNTASDSDIILSTGWVGRWLENLDPDYPTDVKSGDDPLGIDIGVALNPVFQGTTSGMGIAVSDPSQYTSSAAPPTDVLPDTHAGAELGFARSIYLQADVYGSRFKSLFSSTPTNNVAYPTLAGSRTLTSIAAQLQKVAWCVAAGMKTKIYFVQVGSFDTHIQQNSKDNTAGQGRLLFELSQAIAAFQADLEAFGVADRVIGMTYSEFGRRVNANASMGTDHGTCAPQFVFGSQVNGEMYSTDPDLKNLDSNGDLVWNVDFRQMYTAVLGDWFGVSEPLRKAILMDTTSTGERFKFDIPVNGSGVLQSIIRTPAAVQNQVAPVDFVLAPYPNPFTTSATVHVELPRTMSVRLDVYSERGELVQEIVNRSLSRGSYDFTFDGRRLPNGTYLCRMEAGSDVAVRQMKLVR